MDINDALVNSFVDATEGRIASKSGVGIVSEEAAEIFRDPTAAYVKPTLQSYLDPELVSGIISSY